MVRTRKSSIVGKSTIIEEWYDEKDNNNEKHIKVRLLPLVDGFLKLPQIEFFTSEIKNPSNVENNEEENEQEFIVGKMNFETIEYDSIFEGNEKVIKIIPLNECSLKLNLT